MFGWFEKKIAIEVVVDDGGSEKIIHWVVGEDVDRATYKRLKDEEGRLHVLTVFRDGEKEAYITTKQHYAEARETAAKAFEPNALQEKAESGDVSAQCGLGFLYFEGEGVPQDDVEAEKWFRKAAEQNDADAQTYLGMLYAQGRGVSKDLVLAYMWFSLAAIRGNETAVRGRQLAAEQMTPLQITDAENLIQKWKPQRSSQSLQS